jgi:hypothetical protein
MTRQAIGFLGTGSYLPERAVSNEELADLVPDVSPEWIVGKTAIQCRRFAAEHEATSDLAANAVLTALDHAGLPPGQVDYRIVASTGDFPQPPTASIVRQRTGTTAAACLDINVVCTGSSTPSNWLAAWYGPTQVRTRSWSARTSTRGYRTSMTAAPRSCSVTARVPRSSARSATDTGFWTSNWALAAMRNT